MRLLRPNGREVWQASRVEFELTARSDGAILKKLRPWIVAAELGRYWPVLFVVADERVRDKIASIGYNLEIPVVAATVEDFVIWLAMGLRTDFRARPVRGYGPYLPAEGRQSVKAGFFGGSRKDSYAFLWASGPSPMTASMRFFSCSRSSSGVVPDYVVIVIGVEVQFVYRILFAREDNRKAKTLGESCLVVNTAPRPILAVGKV